MLYYLKTTFITIQYLYMQFPKYVMNVKNIQKEITGNNEKIMLYNKKQKKLKANLWR